MRWIAAFLFVMVAAGAEYTLAPAPGSKFQLEVYKTGLMSGKVHVFTFEKYSGTLNYAPDAPEQSKVSFTVDNQSIVCHDTWVSDKDKIKIAKVAHESMETEKHPQMTFQSQKVARRSDGAFDVTGPLTIKGLAKPVTIRVSVAAEGKGLRLHGKAVLLRKDYGINPRAAVPFGLIGNKEEMPVEFNLLAMPR